MPLAPTLRSGKAMASSLIISPSEIRCYFELWKDLITTCPE
jgi:hypothetical protein